ncbi:MAG: DNA internalization-related competence protein ComEC/Rec2 [Gammaproteobacteria bacterium]|nr:DNA internalization-related competence protein ComEC/Rec2 [Gammaproteobacteria bacterium]
MRLSCLAFLLGVVFLQFFSVLPTIYVSIIIFSLAIFCKISFKKKIWKMIRLLIASALGFAWALVYAHMIMTNKILVSDEGKDITLSGYIASIPHASSDQTNFLFKTHNKLVQLSWRDTTEKLSVGDKWELHVKLKRPHGTLNPGGFDYEAWAFQTGINASGYVNNKFNNHLISSHWYHYSIDRLRQLIAIKMSEVLPVSPTSPWITALAVGERYDINADQWAVLRNTGTNHLMAIAGLHIGMMALLANFLVARSWKQFSRLTNKIPAVYAGELAALMMGLLYSALAGFSLPAQRASLMLTFFILALLFKRNSAAWQAWCYALFVVLILNPLTVLTESFWLSFGSVALIIYGMSNRVFETGWWWKWGRIQWVIALGLVPLSIALFQQCSLISFIANNIAIPCVGFILVPMIMLGCVLLFILPAVGAWLLCLSDKILGLVWKVLMYLSSLHNVVWYQHVPHYWMLIAAIIGVIILLLPIGVAGRYVGLIWILPLLLFKESSPKIGEMQFTLLDVGQGLSAVVQTHNHVLVFDAGAKYSSNYDMGASVVVPYLHTLGIKNVDMLVISHGDNDHIGGADAILKAFNVRDIKTSVPEKFNKADYCERGAAWRWEGVDFRFLYPTLAMRGLNNNSSCVLKISSADKSILLTGDIEKLAEKELVQNQKEYLKSDILVAPHHGSKTSAEDEFLSAVKPDTVLFAIGYRNRYHFPHASVIQKYTQLNVNMLDSVHGGAIQFLLHNNERLALPELYRVTHKHYWND